jgi:hypothetical protein
MPASQQHSLEFMMMQPLPLFRPMPPPRLLLILRPLRQLVVRQLRQHKLQLLLALQLLLPMMTSMTLRRNRQKSSG